MRFGEWLLQRLGLLRLDPCDVEHAVGDDPDAVRRAIEDDTLSGTEPYERAALAVVLQVPLGQLEAIWLERIDLIPDTVRTGPNAPPARPKSTDLLEQSGGVAWVGRVVPAKARAVYEESWDATEGQRLPVRLVGRRWVYALETPGEFLILQLLQPSEMRQFISGGGGQAVVQLGDSADWAALFGWLSVPDGNGDAVRVKLSTVAADGEAEEERLRVPLAAIARVSRLIRRLPRDADGKINWSAVDPDDTRIERVVAPEGRYAVVDEHCQDHPDPAAVEVQVVDPMG